MSTCPPCGREMQLLPRSGCFPRHAVTRGAREQCRGSGVTPADAAAGITSTDRQVEDHYIRRAVYLDRDLTAAERADLVARGIER